jgi:hypothetical protein
MLDAIVEEIYVVHGLLVGDPLPDALIIG